MHDDTGDLFLLNNQLNILITYYYTVVCLSYNQVSYDYKTKTHRATIFKKEMNSQYNRYYKKTDIGDDE